MDGLDREFAAIWPVVYEHFLSGADPEFPERELIERLYLVELAPPDTHERMPALRSIGDLTDRLVTLVSIMQQAHAYRFGRLASPQASTDAHSADVSCVHDADTGRLAVVALVDGAPWSLGEYDLEGA